MTKRWKRRFAYGAFGVALGAALLVWYVPLEIALLPQSVPKLEVVLLDVPKAFPRGARVTLVTAHPDDAEFYLGATLPQIRDAGAELSLVVVTDGDKGYYPFEDAEGNRRVRDAEQREAARLWGAKRVTFLHFPDGRVQSGERLNASIRAALEESRPEIVLSFDDLYRPRRNHADHARVGEAVAAILPSLKGVRAIGRFSSASPNRIVDATSNWEEKLALMKVHKSQFDTPRNGLVDRLIGRAGDNPFDFIRRLVESLARREGARVGVRLGEGLRWSELSSYNAAMRSVLTFLTLTTALLVLSPSSEAGTLDVTSVCGGGMQFGDPAYICQWSCASIAPNMGATSITYSKMPTAALFFEYRVTSLLDLPPTSVTASYSASTTGSWSYALLGRSSPSGTASGNYTVTQTQGMYVYTISDSFGPVAQQTTYVGAEGAEKKMLIGATNQVISTPSNSWTLTDNQDGTYTYKRAYTSWSLNGNTTANCNVIWKGSNGRSSWTHVFHSYTAN